MHLTLPTPHERDAGHRSLKELSDARQADNPRTKLPVVSVLTPSFNQGRWLADCLRSVQLQTYPHIEHIVMDGGSSDGSQEILQRTEGAVIWQSRPDGGLTDALNRAFASSHGDIIGWINSDDGYFGPNVVTDVVNLFWKRPDVDVIYGHAALVNAEGLLLHLFWVPPFSAKLLKRQNFINAPTAFVRRSALKGKYMDESYQYAVDRELWLRLATTSKFARLPKVLAIDRHQLGRKGITMGHLAKIENARLAQSYGCLPTSGGPVFKLWRIATRLLGLSLIFSARRGPHAFSARSDSLLKLVLRQVATPRTKMPAGM